MSSIAFDTLKYVRRLKEAGVPEQQAEAEAEALAEVLDAQGKGLVTATDLHDALDPVRQDIGDLRSDMRLIKWMLALVIITTVVPALKSLFS
jgi:predicted RNA-binding protein associated with RNAse of E/G family